MDEITITHMLAAAMLETLAERGYPIPDDLTIERIAYDLMLGTRIARPATQTIVLRAVACRRLR